TGQLLGEYTGAATYGKEYIYLGSQQVASARTNQAPEAQAGADRSVNGGASVQLDGRGSRDPDGVIERYLWQQTAGTLVILSGAATAIPSFTAPVLTATSTLGFTLTVTDDKGEEASDSVTVTVRGNAPPLADAGPDQRLRGGEPVILDGSASRDPDGTIRTYAWVQSEGTPVTLSGTHAAIASFTSPRIGTEEVLRFTLTVSDDRGAAASDSVQVILLPNGAPTANAGIDHTIDGGTLVTLDGGGSIDPEGLPLTYQWVQTAGTRVPLTNSSTAQAIFTAPYGAGPLMLEFTLTVTDDYGAQASDTLTVTVQPQADSTDTQAPRTHYGRSRTEVEGVLAYTITLTANEPASVYFRVGGVGSIVTGASPTPGWQIYGSPITVVMTSPGQATVEYYAVDAAGNVEAMETKLLRRSR
ncbi:MAG: PKD domain-containing protein, partial [Chromatiales bacterium]